MNNNCHIEIKSDSEDGKPTYVKINGVEINKVKGISYKVDMENAPVVTLSFIAPTVDIDIKGKVKKVIEIDD